MTAPMKHPQPKTMSALIQRFRQGHALVNTATHGICLVSALVWGMVLGMNFLLSPQWGMTPVFTRVLNVSMVVLACSALLCLIAVLIRDACHSLLCFIFSFGMVAAISAAGWLQTEILLVMMAVTILTGIYKECYAIKRRSKWAIAAYMGEDFLLIINTLLTNIVLMLLQGNHS